MEDQRILFVSRYSQHSNSAIQACNKLGLTNIINIIYLDSAESRELIKSDKFVTLNHVPTLIEKNQGSVRAFVGPKVIQYMKQLYVHIRRQYLQTEGNDEIGKEEYYQRRKKHKKKPKKKTKKAPKPTHSKPTKKKKSSKKPPVKEESSESEEEESSESEESIMEESSEEESDKEEFENDESEPIEPPVINDKGKVNVAEAIASAGAMRDNDLGYRESELPYH